MNKKSNSAKKILTPNNRKELGDWLAKQNMDINTIHRDCTDCVVVAKIIKKFFPKLIDLYSYQERNSLKLKLENWKKLNVKVLNNLELPQKTAELQKYVNGDKDAICSLLFSIMRAHGSTLEKETEGAAGDAEENDFNDKQQVLVNIERVVDDEVVKVEQKMINYAAYEAARQDFKRYDDLIKVASKKVQELELKVNAKSDEIDDLVKELAKQTVIAMDKEKAKQSSPEDQVPEETPQEPVQQLDEETLP